MPSTARLLYYDLGMSADDDGIVEAFTVMRTTGAAEDDLRVLATRGFVSVLNDDLVSFIRDWSINNQVRKDRYHPSVYAGLLVKIEDGNQMETTGQPCGNQRETEVRLGKDSLGKDSLGEREKADKPPTRQRFTPPTEDEVRTYCTEKGYNIDPGRFVDYYAAKGWKIGSGQMKDWKATVRNWARRDEAAAKPKPEEELPEWAARSII
jgi:hypothetical protein